MYLFSLVLFYSEQMIHGAFSRSTKTAKANRNLIRTVRLLLLQVVDVGENVLSVYMTDLIPYTEYNISVSSKPTHSGYWSDKAFLMITTLQSSNSVISAFLFLLYVLFLAQLQLLCVYILCYLFYMYIALLIFFL